MMRQRHLDIRRRLTSAAFDGTRERASVPGPRERGETRLARPSWAVEVSAGELWPPLVLELVDARPVCAACGSREHVAFAAFDLERGESLCFECWNSFAPVFLAAAARGRVA